MSASHNDVSIDADDANDELNDTEEEGMSSFNPADVERLRNNDRYVER